jgi:hypothetical protein
VSTHEHRRDFILRIAAFKFYLLVAAACSEILLATIRMLQSYRENAARDASSEAIWETASVDVAV